MGERRQELPLGKKLAFAGVAVVGFFVLVELVLAVAGVEPIVSEEDPYIGFDSYTPLFVRDDSGGELETAPNKRAWFNDQRFAAVKPAGTFRIFTLGGSTTYGRPYDHEVSFSHWLELLLDEMDSGRDYEVINAGGISYASYRVVVLMQELVQYDPDLFVVYTGHNEFLEERTYRDIIDDGPIVRALRRGASRLRTAALLDSMLRVERERDELPAEVKAKLDVWSGLEAFTRDDSRRESVIAHYRFNVERMIDVARHHDVPIVFVELASNLKDFSPFKSEPGSGLASERLERFRRAYDMASRAPAGEECSEVMSWLEEARKLSPEYADVHYRLGRCHLARGDVTTARKHLVRAKELDVAPLRALEAMNEILREVTRDERVPLVPFRALLEEDGRARYGHGLLGNEYFLDHVHPRVEVHQELAEWILEALDREGMVTLDETWSDVETTRLYESFLDTLDASYYAQRDLNLGKVLGWAEQNAEAAAAFERAREAMPANPELLRNLGIVYQKERDFERAIESYRALLRLRPNDPEIHFNLGKCYQGLSAWAEAARSFEKALELAPGDAKSHYNLALTLRALGRYQDELTELEAAWEADPTIPGIASLLGSVYAREGRLDDAIEAFERSLEVEPDVAATHYHLASALAAGGRRGRALEHFRRAKELGIDVPDLVFEELEAGATEESR